MAYSGWLVKIGNGSNSLIVPFEYIQYDTYIATYQPIDVDSGESTANGELDRTVLDRRKLKVEWSIPPCDNVMMQKFWKMFKDRWSGATEKQMKIHVTAYIPYLDKYVEDDCYMTADLNFPIRYADANVIQYDAVRVALIGYTTRSATYNGV